MLPGMDSLNGVFHALLDRAYELMQPFGAPIAVAAWLSVFGGAIVMIPVLRRYALRDVWRPALLLGCLSLLAQISDYVVTLHVSPDLAIEANPVWRIVIDQWGLEIAKLYGLSGKILLSVLSFELFSYYLAQRRELYPPSARGFREFWRGFGFHLAPGRMVNWRRLASFFAFSFALLGPFYLYVALLNSLVDSSLYYRFPAMPLVLAWYLAVVTLAYFVLTYRAFVKSASSAPRAPIVALLLLVALAPPISAGETRAAELPAAPDGYHWQQIARIHAAFLVPDGWHFTDRSHGSTLAYFITRENLDELGYHEVGLSLNVFRNLEGRDAVDYARRFVAKMTQENQSILTWETDTKPFHGFGSLTLNRSAEDGVSFKMNTLAMGNSTTNTLYVLWFEAPEAEWDAAWKIGEPIQRQFVLDDGM